MKVYSPLPYLCLVATAILLVSSWFLPGLASASYSITAKTWNIIGLDSNRPASGPNRFPVGATVCSTEAATGIVATFVWDSASSAIYLKDPAENTVTIPALAAGGCAEVFFDVEVAPNATSFDQARRYHISVPGASTPTPRELYVEHLISQFRNAVLSVKLDGVLVPPGGTMAMVIGKSYTLTLTGGTAPQGYNQFSQFLNIPNKLFDVTSVFSTYSANTSPNVAGGGIDPATHRSVYADACYWENDPNSPIYRECGGGDFKSGGNTAITTYTLKVKTSATAHTESLSALLYDFSGSSFHYNADFSSVRYITFVDPNLTISKSFSPSPATVNGVSALTFVIDNPNAATVTGLNFIDNLPTSPGAMVVAPTPGITTSGCGTPTFAPAAGAATLTFTGGKVASLGRCIVKVNVTMPATGTYNNDSENLFIDLIDTTDDAKASLVVGTAPTPPLPPASCTTPVVLASWTMGTGPSSGSAPLLTSKAADVDGTITVASYVGTGSQAISAVGGSLYSWGATSGDAAGWGETAASNAKYLQFVLDTSKYGGVRVSYDAGLYANSDWASPNSNIFVKTIADAGTPVLYTPTSTGTKGNWTTGLVAAAPVSGGTGTSTTTFRFSTDGASKPAATLNLDNVVFSGCPRPTPPQITKSFAPDPVAVGGVSVLTFTLTNPNTSALTGVTFSDNLPAGLRVAATPGATTTCTGSPTWAPGATDTSLTFGAAPNGAGIPASSTCVVRVNIEATTAGPHTNISGAISAAESGVNDKGTGIATASLFAISPPTIDKQFSPDAILAGATSTLVFNITNPNQNNALAGVKFTDPFPAGLVVAAAPNLTTSGCGASLDTSVVGTVSLVGAGIAAGGTCRLTVDVTAPTAGSYLNTTLAVTHLINGVYVGTDTATDTLTVNAATPQISILKQISTSATGPWSQYAAVKTGNGVYYKFTVENVGDVSLAPVTVADPDVTLSGCGWPSLPVAIASTEDHIKTCTGGPVTTVAGVITNTATASGSYGGNPYTDTSSADYATIGVALAKNAAESYFTASGAGNTITYSYIVSNTGAAVLGGAATVADDKVSVTCPSFTTAKLKAAPTSDGNLNKYLDTDEQITCSATYTVDPVDVTNKAITNVASATISGVQSATDTVTVPLAPDLQAKKTNSVGGTMSLATYGSTFDWTLTVFNTATAGNATIADTKELLKDELPTSGATYTVGTVSKAGASGPISCSILANVLTCTADGGTVTIPSNLTGTISVTTGSNEVNGAGTTFSSQLSATSPSNSVILIAGVPYTVTAFDAITPDTKLTIYPVYAGIDAVGLIVPGSFSVPITVTPTSGVGTTLANPVAAGVCKADSGAVVPEIDETNNTCGDTVTIKKVPSLTIVKSVATYSDPINGTTDPKAIPGAFMDYTILVTNTGIGTVDNDTTVITDKIPTETELFVGDLDGGLTTSSSPVLFTNGTTASGLSFSFANSGVPATDLNDATDDLSFSGNGTDYLKNNVLSDPATGCDASVTDLKVALKGVLAGSNGTNHPSFSLKVRMRVK